MSGARRVWTVVAAALLSALTVLLLCRYTVADPAYYTGAVREADGYQRVYDEVLPDPAVRRALRTGALGIPLRSDAVLENLPLLVPRPALEEAADRQARALVAALTGAGRPSAPGLDAAWRGPVTESATEAGSDQLRALRADADPAAARGLTHLITRLRTYAPSSTPAAPPTSALRSAVAGFVHDTWPPGAARRIMTALDEVLPGGGAPAADPGPAAEVRLPLVAGGNSRAGAEPGPPLVAGGHPRAAAELRPPLVARGDAVGLPGPPSAAVGDVAVGADAPAGRGVGPRAPLAVGGGPGAGVDVFASGRRGAGLRAPLVARGDAAGRPRPPLVAGGHPGAGAGPRPPLVRERAAGSPLVASGGAVGDGRGAVVAGGGVGTGGGLQALGEVRAPLVAGAVAGAETDPATEAASGLPGWLPVRGAVVRTVLAASASWWAVAGVAAAAAGAGALALRAAARGGRPRARTAAAACWGAAALTAAAGTAVWATLPASAGLVPDGLPPSVSALLTDVVAGLYREAALAWAGALLALALTAAALALTTSATARGTLHRTLAVLADPAARTPAITAPARVPSGTARGNVHRPPDTPAPTPGCPPATNGGLGRVARAPATAADPRLPAPEPAPGSSAAPPPPGRAGGPVAGPEAARSGRVRRTGADAASASVRSPAAGRPAGAPATAAHARLSAPEPAPGPFAAPPPPGRTGGPVAGAQAVRHRRTPPPAGVPAAAPEAVRLRRVRRAALVAAALVAAVAQVWVLVGVPSEAALACNGDIALCDRPYDRVVQVGSHNAMATVPDGFLGAHQDVSLTGQLDRGARALLLDTHYWETAERLVPPAGTGGLDAAARATLVRAVDSVVRPRPGTWLCHGPCRMGATPLTARLRELRDWLESHPRDVVTLILQDAVTPADTARAFRAAGLGPYLHRPGPDPAAPWPTLGEMTGSGRRLVVFAEEAEGPAPWYRNFYDYAVETPYHAGSAADFSCAPHRGGSDPRKQLFLLNHFVTRGMGAPRAEAAAVNDADVIVDRARTCALLRGRLPTIVAVNHLTLGDAVGAVRRLNAETP